MRITGTHWAIHYPEGKTKQRELETDNAVIANTLLVGLEIAAATIVSRGLQREINDLNEDLKDSLWKIERLVSDVLNDISIGAHLVSSRTAYSHHGIHVGAGKVIHYAGLANGLNAGPVEEVNIVDFTCGNGYSIKAHPNAKFSGEQASGRARSRIGESLYCVFANNCEHFCEWCITGEHHSVQVGRGASVFGSGLAPAAGLVARGVVAASGTVVGVSGPGVMSGLATVGGFVGGGAVAGVGVLGGVQGVAMASLVNNTVLKDNPALGKNDRDSRAMGRIASYVGAGAGTAGGIASISALGSVAGLSATGISSGLASIGAFVGGGMAAGVVVVSAAPVVLAAATGYGLYRLVKFAKGSDPQAISNSDKPQPVSENTPAI